MQIHLGDSSCIAATTVTAADVAATIASWLRHLYDDSDCAARKLRNIAVWYRTQLTAL
jgi:hypothetical protein